MTATSAPSDQIVEWVKALLKKTVDNGCTEGEAQSAAEKVQDLLLKYNLSMFDIDAKGEAHRSSGIRAKESMIDFGKSQFAWKVDLVRLVAEHNLCRILEATTERGKVVGVNLLGLEQNIAVTVELIGWLFDQIKRLGTEGYRAHKLNGGHHIDPLRWHTSFATGVTHSLADRFYEIRRHQQESANMQALVVSVEDVLREYLEDTRPHMKAARERREKWEAQAKENIAKHQQWVAEHPEEAARQAEELRRAAADQEARWRRDAEKQQKRDAAYYRKHGHYPGEGLRVAQPKTRRVNSTAYSSGQQAAEQIDLNVKIGG